LKGAETEKVFVVENEGGSCDIMPTAFPRFDRQEAYRIKTSKNYE
jgi:hypothetical protein